MGEIFWIDVPFEDEPDESKIRSAVIVGVDEEGFILVAITSISLKDPLQPYDVYKIPLMNWHKSGLTKPSWVLGLRLLKFTHDDFTRIIKSKEDFIGKMNRNDFETVIRKLETFHND